MYERTFPAETVAVIILHAVMCGKQRTVTNATVTNATVTNATVTNATATNATVTNATATNATVTNATGTNACRLQLVNMYMYEQTYVYVLIPKYKKTNR
jgi:hypothetical protein